MRPRTLQTETGRRVREAAREAGYSLKELGAKLGVSRPTIYAYASGALRISEGRLEQIAAIVGRPKQYLRPQHLRDLDERSNTGSIVQLLQALLSPPDPVKAASMASRVTRDDVSLDPPAIRAEVQFASGQALAQQGQYLDAIPRLEEAMIAFQDGGTMDRAAAASQTLGQCYMSVGQLEQARKAFRFSRDYAAPMDHWRGEVSLAALAEREGDFVGAQERLEDLFNSPLLLSEFSRPYILANRASLFAERGVWDESIAFIDEAIGAGYLGNSPDQVAECMVLRGLALIQLGQFDDASVALTRAKDMAYSLGDTGRQTLTTIGWGYLYLAIGDLEAARERGVEALTDATRNKLRRCEARAIRLLAEVAAARGDHAQARDYSLQALTHAQTYGYPVEVVRSNSMLVEALTALGRTDEAVKYAEIEPAPKLRTSLGEPLARRHLALARLAEAKGDTDEAAALIGSAVALARKHSLLPLLASALEAQARVGSDQDAASEAERIRQGFGQTPVFTECGASVSVNWRHK